MGQGSGGLGVWGSGGLGVWGSGGLGVWESGGLGVWGGGGGQLSRLLIASEPRKKQKQYSSLLIG